MNKIQGTIKGSGHSLEAHLADYQCHLDGKGIYRVTHKYNPSFCISGPECDALTFCYASDRPILFSEIERRFPGESPLLKALAGCEAIFPYDQYSSEKIPMNLQHRLNEVDFYPEKQQVPEDIDIKVKYLVEAHFPDTDERCKVLLFKTVPHFTKLYWFDEVLRVKKPAGSTISHIYYYIPGGNVGIKRIMEWDPAFFPTLFKYIYKYEDLTLHRIDFSVDYSEEVMKHIVHYIQRDKYNSFNSQVRAFSDGFTFAEEDIKDLPPSIVKYLKQKGAKPGQNLSIGRNSQAKKYITPQGWDNITSLYIGNYKRSDIICLIYNKKKERQTRKKDMIFGAATRLELRHFNADKPVSITSTFMDKLTRKPKLLFDTEVYAEIFQDYNSEKSLGIRSLMVMAQLLHSFTLVKSPKAKSVLQSWYVENMIFPLLFVVQKTLSQFLQQGSNIASSSPKKQKEKRKESETKEKRPVGRPRKVQKDLT